MLNHSSDAPNVGLDPPVRVPEGALEVDLLKRVPNVDAAIHSHSPMGRWVFPMRALTDIHPGEELLWNYSTEPTAIGVGD